MTLKIPYRPAYLCLCVCCLYCKEVPFFQRHKHTYVHFMWQCFYFILFFFATWSVGDITCEKEGENYIRKEKWALFINLLYKSLTINSLCDILQMMCLWVVFFFLFACPCPFRWNLCTTHKEKWREKHTFVLMRAVITNTKYSFSSIFVTTFFIAWFNIYKDREKKF